ncbi:hypothetical protein GCM10010521_58740 [Streptomyces rameus]|uniref:Uncharacterized protein n=1 Tax=Streptomyces rameus TaxID=68261 RepID=A0ABP6HEW6_9ACTN
MPPVGGAGGTLRACARKALREALRGCAREALREALRGRAREALREALRGRAWGALRSGAGRGAGVLRRWAFGAGPRGRQDGAVERRGGPAGRRAGRRRVPGVGAGGRQGGGAGGRQGGGAGGAAAWVSGTGTA